MKTIGEAFPVRYVATCTDNFGSLWCFALRISDYPMLFEVMPILIQSNQDIAFLSFTQLERARELLLSKSAAFWQARQWASHVNVDGTWTINKKNLKFKRVVVKTINLTRHQFS